MAKVKAGQEENAHSREACEQEKLASEGYYGLDW